MKTFLIAALAAASASAAGISQCMYCRNEDLHAGFLFSYSYCENEENPECLADAWNYMRRDCKKGWKRGNKLSLGECEPDEILCPEFKSSQEKYQKYQNTTWSMAAGSKCNVRVDATAGIARVIFSNTLYLGIESHDALVDDIITIQSGIVDIEIYNAAETGPITFGISFSGATTMLASATALAALTLLSF